MLLLYFSCSFTSQINLALGDETRVIEKTRVLVSESKRLYGDKRNSEIERNDDLDAIDDEILEAGTSRKRTRQKELYDEEVYDDRQFYSMLLKTFITSSSNPTNGMRKEDILAMQKYKRKKISVDRKASKGRKVRYVTHPKLQNFMFPIRHRTADDIIDNRLFNSLFQ